MAEPEDELERTTFNSIYITKMLNHYSTYIKYSEYGNMLLNEVVELINNTKSIF